MSVPPNREFDDNSLDEMSTNEGEVRRQSVSEMTEGLWRRFVPEHIHNIFLPQHPRSQLLPNEEIQLEIHLAWYRDAVAVLIYQYSLALFVITCMISALLGIFGRPLGLAFIFALQLPFFLLIALVTYGLFQHFQFSQWRLIKTNARLIISMPQKDAWYLVDNIEMNNMPKVIDANWSTKGFKRFLQALTGARDLYISLGGLQFVEGSAVVRDAIVIPDVDDKDVQKLKRLIFLAS